MKVLLDKYPKGSLPRQKTDGRYIDHLLYENLELMADTITNDMTFMGVIFSSTLEVGTGKSVLATQIGEVWAELIKKKHNIDLNYGLRNIVWRPKELIERAFEVPKYSYVLLDEWEDAHYWSELGTTLRQFFRKCRQLNLFIMIIIPNWFQLPINYAISRSIFAIDVKFGERFKRGLFDFYGFEAKKYLYVKGKKFHSYHVQKADFNGVFYDGYGVPEKEYRKRKLEDMEKWDSDDKKSKRPQELRDRVIVSLYLSGMTQEEIARRIGAGRQTITDIIKRKAEADELKRSINVLNAKKQHGKTLRATYSRPLPFNYNKKTITKKDNLLK